MKEGSQNIVADKSMDFAVRIVNLSLVLRERRDERTLSSQILRSGTSIGANIREAKSAQSKADFISKLSIAIKECDETAEIPNGSLSAETSAESDPSEV